MMTRIEKLERLLELIEIFIEDNNLELNEEGLDEYGRQLEEIRNLVEELKCN